MDRADLIVLALGFAIAAVCVALRCDGKELDYLTVRNHSVPPAVLLSVFATLASSVLLHAFTQGATIHRWRMAFDARRWLSCTAAFTTTTA